MAVADAAPNPARERFVFLDALRGVAALAIVVHHYTLDAGHGEVFASAGVAVDFFFCLSGFVIAHAYHERLAAGMPLGQYALRRLIRLYPMYAVGTLLGLVALVAFRFEGLTDMGYGAIAMSTVLNLFYIPYFDHSSIHVFAVELHDVVFPLDNPAWSLFFGVLANMLYAACVKLDERLILVVAFLAGVALYFANFALGGAPGWGLRNFVGGFPRVLFSFFAGVVIFRYRRHWSVPGLAPAFLVALFVGIVLSPPFPGYWLAMVLIVVPALVACSAAAPMPSQGWQLAAARFAGRISYPVFCIHYPLLMLFSLVPWNAERMSLLSMAFVKFAVLSAAFLATTLAAAWLLARFVEPPLQRRLRDAVFR